MRGPGHPHAHGREHAWDPKATGTRRFLVLAATLALAAACGGGSDNSDADTGGGTANLSDATVIMGTTDTAVHLDPGGAYDLGSSTSCTTL